MATILDPIGGGSVSDISWLLVSETDVTGLVSSTISVPQANGRYKLIFEGVNPSLHAIRITLDNGAVARSLVDVTEEHYNNGYQVSKVWRTINAIDSTVMAMQSLWAYGTTTLDFNVYVVENRISLGGSVHSTCVGIDTTKTTMISTGILSANYIIPGGIFLGFKCGSQTLTGSMKLYQEVRV